MCGILGLFHLRGAPLSAAEGAPLALAALRHRGPDDSAFWRDTGVFLGATRLALVDPAHGRQPVRDEAGRYHLVMNGELFPDENTSEVLRSRGHRLRSRCDTEFAVHLFEEQWSGALEQIDGQYAIAVHDRAERRLLLARDRMGICPLYYALVGEVLVFASEPKALFALGLLEPRIDPLALDSVLAFGCVAAPQTTWLGIRALEPGTFLEARDGALKVIRYWDCPYPDAGTHRVRSAAAATEELESLLDSAVRKRLRADAPVGLFLSGGLDSSVVAGLAARQGKQDLRTYTIGFPETAFDERNRTRELAGRLGLSLDEVLSTQPDVAAAFPDHVFHLESPTIVTFGVSLEALTRRAARDVKAALTGSGADELFGGYDFFGYDYWRRRVEQSFLSPLLVPLCRRALRFWLGVDDTVFPSDGSRAWSTATFGFHPAFMIWMSRWRALRELLYSDDMLARPAALTAVPAPDFPRTKMQRWEPLDRSLYVTGRLWLSEFALGSLGDRTSMAHSLEQRHPFLDRQVVEFAAGAAPALKWRPFQEKLLLRQTARRILPSDCPIHRKQPFQAPLGTPFVGPDSPDWCRELLSRRRIESSGWFQPVGIEGAVRRLAAYKERDRLAAVASGRSRRISRAESLAYYRDGAAVTFALSVQLLDDFVRRGRFSPSQLAPVAAGTEPVEVS